MKKNPFEEIDTKLLYGIKCSDANLNQQNYFERLKLQTESAFINKKFS
tara:strand:- start:173 stop:316 length:144 start_codon:yes stop_codon:yes gene_type:complete